MNIRKIWKVLEKNGCVVPVLLVCTFFFLGGVMIQSIYMSILYNSGGFESEVLVVDSVAYHQGGYKNPSYILVFGQLESEKNISSEIGLKLPESYNINYSNQKEIIGERIPVWFNAENYPSRNSMINRKKEGTEFDIQPILQKMLKFFLIFNFPLLLLLLIREILNKE